MGWSVKVKEEKGVTKYRIWTSICDGWITEWLTKEEIAKFFFWNHFHTFMENFLKDAITFPDGFHDKDTGKRFHNEAGEYFRKFLMESHDVEGKQQSVVLAEKFSEILNKYGIELKVKDNDGYSFNSKEE